MGPRAETAEEALRLALEHDLADDSPLNAATQAAASDAPSPAEASPPSAAPGVELTIPWNEKALNGEQVASLIINHAVEVGASDIFLTTNEADVTVTVRLLGLVARMTVLPLELGVRVIAHMRTVGGLKFGERRVPQDGRWVFRLANNQVVDLRLNSVPTLFGEGLAARIMVRDSQLQRLDRLGFVGPQLGHVISVLHANSGLVLVTGPTGSGKTTTLYAFLHYLNNGQRKIHTIEDPVEYAVAGLHQTQVDAYSIASGGDFPEMLRGVMRQGADVIMIGEVRDSQTAQTAVRAANSGQLVFATLHAATAAGAVQSLLGFDVSPHFLCTSLLAVLGQRLMRTVAKSARQPLLLAPEVFAEIGPWLPPGQSPTPFAVDPSLGSVKGYDGRTGLFEILTLTPGLRRAIMDHRATGELHQQAIQGGMLDFQRAALLKVALGETTFDEMQRVLPTSEAWSEA